MEARRRLVLAGVFALTTVTWIGLRAGPAAGAWAERSEELVASRSIAIRRARTELARAPVLGDSITRLEGVVEKLSRHILPGGDRDVAAIEVGRRILEALELAPTRGGDPVVLSADSTRVGRFRRILVGSTFTTDFVGARTVLVNLEEDVALWIDSLEVRLEGALLDEDAPEKLKIHVIVGAWHAER